MEVELTVVTEEDMRRGREVARFANRLPRDAVFQYYLKRFNPPLERTIARVQEDPEFYRRYPGWARMNTRGLPSFEGGQCFVQPSGTEWIVTRDCVYRYGRLWPWAGSSGSDGWMLD